jgi:hypothetical protein
MSAPTDYVCSEVITTHLKPYLSSSFQLVTAWLALSVYFMGSCVCKNVIAHPM